SGITLPVLPKRDATGFEERLNECVERIRHHILEKENTFDLGFLPSTTLAYGYFVNFVEKTVERLLEDKQAGKIFHLEDGKLFTIKKLLFTVLIPDNISDDMFKKVKAKRLKDGWQKLKVEPKEIRDYDFSVDVSKVEDGLLHLVDIPFTLNALGKAIDLYSRVEHIGKDEREALLEQRALRNFKRALDYLVQHSAITKDLVETEVVDV
ncbi:MAG TPA: STING domain-containing protein, partial [Flavisolibacter sp.]|nr:STING domain-containing protein [Flavisolibacter sp.]